jgi:spore maturation protein CgeB
MAAMGYCPSGRLFEAAACGVAIVSDWWEGLDQFYTPRTEILVCHTTGDVLAALRMPDGEIASIARAARERTLDCHTAAHRARELVALLERSVPNEENPVCGESFQRPGREAAFNR